MLRTGTVLRRIGAIVVCSSPVSIPFDAPKDRSIRPSSLLSFLRGDDVRGWKRKRTSSRIERGARAFEARRKHLRLPSAWMWSNTFLDRLRESWTRRPRGTVAGSSVQHLRDEILRAKEEKGIGTANGIRTPCCSPSHSSLGSPRFGTGNGTNSSSSALPAFRGRKDPRRTRDGS